MTAHPIDGAALQARSRPTNSVQSARLETTPTRNEACAAGAPPLHRLLFELGRALAQLVTRASQA